MGNGHWRFWRNEHGTFLSDEHELLDASKCHQYCNVNLNNFFVFFMKVNTIFFSLDQCHH